MTGVKTIIYYILHVFSKARIFVLSIGLLLVGVLDLVGLSLFIPIIDLIQDKATSHHFITQYFISLFGFFDVPTDARFFLLLLCVVFLVKTTILMWTRYISVEMSANLQHFFRMRLLEGYLYASLEFMYSQKQGVLLSVLSDHTTRAASSFFILIQLILSSFTAVIYLIFIGLVSWELTLAALTGGIVIFPIVRKIGKLSHQYASKNNEFLEISQHSVLESLQAKKMISAMDLIKERIELYNPISIEVRDSWKWVAFWSNSPGIIIQPIAVIILSFLVILSIYLGYSFVLLGAFILAFIRFLPVLQSALTMGAELSAALPSVTRVEELLNASKRSFDIEGVNEFSRIGVGININGVSFSYSRGGKDVFKDVNLFIPEGSTVALIGRSGSGKSTIADLVLGLHSPNKGKVLVDGKNLIEINKQQYRANISYIPQDSILFHDSVRNNLLIGVNRIVGEEELHLICTQTGVWEFVSNSPKGLDTILGDRGVKLSGGQRQRIALARALLRRPQLLILDEATSALDNESEIFIQQALESVRRSGNVTVLIIAHRFTTIKHADIIYEINNHSVDNIGSWKEARDHLYANNSELGLE